MSTFPPLKRQAWNFAVAMAQFALDGFKTTTREEYRDRLTVCDGCDSRDGWRCSECGCVIAIKARVKIEKCDLSKWPILSEEKSE